MTNALTITQLTKQYDTVQALKGVDLTIPAGEFFGLLGPNGAGKTTLISCITGLVRPTSGSMHVFEHDVATHAVAAKACIGFAPQQVNIEYFFPIRRIMEFQGGYFGLSAADSRTRTESMLRRMHLWDKRDEQYFRLSGGMQRRLLVARALMGSPRLLILDEPTAGVDVEQRHQLWALLRELRAQGTTILLTTHYIDEAEALCDRIGIIDHGQLVEMGTPQGLIEKYCERRVIVDVNQPITAEEFSSIGAQLTFEQAGCRAIFQLSPDMRIGPLVEQLVARITSVPDRRIVDLRVCGGDLEDVFLHVTGRSLHVAA